MFNIYLEKRFLNQIQLRRERSLLWTPSGPWSLWSTTRHQVAFCTSRARFSVESRVWWLVGKPAVALSHSITLLVVPKSWRDLNVLPRHSRLSLFNNNKLVWDSPDVSNCFDLNCIFIVSLSSKGILFNILDLYLSQKLDISHDWAAHTAASIICMTESFL